MEAKLKALLKGKLKEVSYFRKLPNCPNSSSYCGNLFECQSDKPFKPFKTSIVLFFWYDICHGWNFIYQ